jgi:hypothetical protein
MASGRDSSHSPTIGRSSGTPGLLLDTGHPEDGSWEWSLRQRRVGEHMPIKESAAAQKELFVGMGHIPISGLERSRPAADATREVSRALVACWVR